MAGTIVNLKVGSLGYWHAVHILLSLATGGVWLIVYAIHAIIATSNRPTVTVEVPEGSRVEYYHGYPHVLAADEYLDKGPRWRQIVTLVVAAGLLAAALAVIVASAA